MILLLRNILASSLGRWVLGGIVAMALGAIAIGWHNHKEGLKEEGRQECVQEINIATVEALEAALVDAESANAALRASLVAAATVNQEATDRRETAEASLRTLEAEMRTQRETDETYREWVADPLPVGVADRLREAARSPSGRND